MAPISDAGTYYENVEVLVADEVVSTATAFLWKVPTTDLMLGEWAGRLGADLKFLGIGAELTLRMSDGRTGQCLIEVIHDETNVVIRGSGPAPF